VLARFRGSSGRLFDVLAPGLYAWGVTVGWPVSQRFAPLGARIFALVALVALVSGGALLFSAPKLARVLGVWVFLAACIAGWGWFAPAFGPLHLDPVQGVLGAVGWAFFAISWAGDAANTISSPNPPSPTTSTPSPRSDRDPAERRHRNVPRAAAAVLALVAVAAAVPMVLSWWVASLERALLAHGVSLAAAIALVAYAVDLFEPRSRAEDAGFDALRKPERRIAAALPAFVALTALVVLGAAYTLLR
jgi:hypothetical protein